MILKSLFSKFLYLGFSVLLPFYGLAQSSVANNRTTTIPFISNSKIVIDGKLDDWKAPNKLFKIDQFVSPWSSPDFGKTEFLAFYDADWFYFSFEIEDKKIVEADFKKESDVALGDRGEIFITADSSLKEYYCFEISPTGKVLDYVAHYYRKFDYNWNLEELEIKSSKTSNGYILEGKMPMSFIKSIDKSYGNTLSNLRFGVFRAEFNNLNPKDPTVNWISWIKPNTNKPDFHTPSAFQKITFEIK